MGYWDSENDDGVQFDQCEAAVQEETMAYQPSQTGL
jgi:hypothetical protein